MPIDPFFTSGGGGDYDGVKRRGRNTAYAKAIQFKINVSRGSKKNRETAIRKLEEHPEMRALGRLKGIMKGNMTQVLGGPAVTGFKEPKKMWVHYKR